jgi:hypothetical protein
MTSKFIRVLVPPAVESPRGAEWAANVAIALARVVSWSVHGVSGAEPASSKTKGLSWKR